MWKTIRSYVVIAINHVEKIGKHYNLLRNAPMESLNQINNTLEMKPTTINDSTTELKMETGIVNEPHIETSNLSQIQETQSHQDIISFLAKPIFIQGAPWATTDARGAVLLSIDPATFITGGGAYAVWTNKLAGFYTFSGTFVWDLVVNGTPFHSGAFMMNYEPMANSMPAFYRTRASTDLNGKSQRPGSVICNVNENHYSFKQPYICSTEMFNLYDTGGRYPDWGPMQVFVWSPLTVGASGETTVSISVYGHWEDVILGAAYPQASGSGRKKVTATKVPSAAAREIKKNPFSLSTGLSTISEAAGTLGSIPSLSGIAGSVSWAAGVASNAAQYFGFAKPTSDAKIERVIHMFGQYCNNGSGSDDSVVQATMHDAGHSIITQKTIYDADEMSLDFIKTRPAYIANITYATTNNVGDQLSKFDFKPAAFWTPITYDTQTFRQYTPVGLLGRCFYQVTGGYKLKVKFFKTAFHMGVLSFTYVPGPEAAATYTTDNTVSANRYIVDLQTTDEIEFTFPWLNPYPNDYTDMSTGSLYVHCMTPLRCPETVGQSVDITYEIFGADDLTFFNPNSTTPMPVICQGATDEVGGIEAITIGEAKPLSDVTKIAQDCVGEQIRSIKQLCNRNTIEWCDKNFTANEQIVIRPFAIGTYSWVAGTHSVTYPNLFGSWYGFWSSCYLFRRGSVRIRIFRPSTASGIITKETHGQESFTGIVTNTTSNNTAIFTSDGSVQLPVKKACDTMFQPGTSTTAIQMPMQSISSVIPNDYFVNVGGLNPQVTQPTNLLTVRSLGTADDLYIGRSGGDDFQLLFWVGVPIMTEGAL